MTAPAIDDRRGALLPQTAAEATEVMAEVPQWRRQAHTTIKQKQLSGGGDCEIAAGARRQQQHDGRSSGDFAVTATA